MHNPRALNDPVGFTPSSLIQTFCVVRLGIIGVNLAVINFLPIPVLDGGHMVFLIYEWIRGKPAPETIRIGATYVGLAVILSLMILVIYLDVKKVF